MIQQTRSNIGDIFEISLEGEKVYFQYLGKDTEQLGSQVIRVFKRKFPNDFDPQIDELAAEEPDFHAHVVIQRGIKEGLWKKAGHAKTLNERFPIRFRRSDDYGNSSIKVSRNWRVWTHGEAAEHVGQLTTDEQKKAEISPVVPPEYIIERIKTGKHPFFYPDYE